MNRRRFLLASAAALVAPAVPERVYAFLRDNPLASPLVTPPLVAIFGDKLIDYVSFGPTTIEACVIGGLSSRDDESAKYIKYVKGRYGDAVLL